MTATASSGRTAGTSQFGDALNPWSADTQTARIEANPTFRRLQSKRARFGWTLTILMLVIYYGFVALVAFVPALIGRPVLGSLTLGLALGLGVIVSAVVLTGVYVARANSEFDRLQAEVVRDAMGVGRHA